MSKSLETPWTLAHQTPLSRGISRQEYWCGLSFPSPGDLPDPGIEPQSPALEGGFFTTEPPGKPTSIFILMHFKITCRNQVVHMYTLLLHALACITLTRVQ